MVIQWNARARTELKSIYNYYLQNANKQIAQRIKKEILETVGYLKDHPNLGHIENKGNELNEELRSLLASKHYKVIYFIDGNHVVILSIWDVRQDPEKLKKQSIL